MKRFIILLLITISIFPVAFVRAQYPDSPGIRFGANVWHSINDNNQLRAVAEFYDMLALNEGNYDKKGTKKLFFSMQALAKNKV